MNLHQRRHQLLLVVNTEGRQSIEDLARRFNVSIQTIRADVRALVERGLVMRRHGEVVPPPTRENAAYGHRQIVNHKGKQAIARLCLNLISDDQTLMLGTGTTVEHLASLLRVRSGLNVITNNFHAAHILCEHQDCSLTIAGGRMRKRDFDVIGGDTLQFFKRYEADVGVVSVGGLSERGKLYDYNDEEVMARESLMQASRTRILVVDSCKFGIETHCTTATLGDFDAVITDQPLNERVRAYYTVKGVRFLSP